MSYFQFHFPCLDGMATLRSCHAYARGRANETQHARMLRKGDEGWYNRGWNG